MGFAVSAELPGAETPMSHPSGFDDATSAEKLRNAELCIPLGKLAELPPDSYYQHDIIGLRVFTLDDKLLGTIIDISGTQQLIPAIKDVIKQIDLIRHTMHIDPIPGLLANSDEQDREEDGESREERE